MTRRVYLHLGTPKSGTSYVQDKLAVNRDRLAASGLLYPPTRTGNHFEAALDLIQKPWAGELKAAQGQWDVITVAAKAAPADVVISHEILAAATPAQVERALSSFPDHQVHLVITARDLARQLPAEWQEKVKHRGRLSFAKFLRQVTQAERNSSEQWFWQVQHLPDILDRWALDVPAERVHLITLPPPGGPKTVLWERFASVMGLDPLADYAETEVANASLGAVETYLVRRLNSALAKTSIDRETYVSQVRGLLAAQTLAARRGQGATLPAAARGFVEEVTDEWVERIAGSGIHLVGSLEDLRPRWPDADVAWSDPDAPDQSETVDAAVDALVALLVELDRTSSDSIRTHPVKRLARRLGAS